MTRAEEKEYCLRCGWARNEHWLANYADGPWVGRGVLVCPTATFFGKEEHKQQRKGKDV